MLILIQNFFALFTCARIWLAIPVQDVKESDKAITQNVGLAIIVIKIKINIVGTTDKILIMKVKNLSNLLNWPIIIPKVKPINTSINVTTKASANEYLKPCHKRAQKSLPKLSVPNKW